MPQFSIQFDNTGFIWAPNIIDAYHAIKVKQIILTVRNSQAVTTAYIIAIGFDKEVPAEVNLNEVSNYIGTSLELLPDTTIIYQYDLDDTIGDFLFLISNSAAGVFTAVVFYERIKTRFDQYGQVSKTLKRLLTK